MNFLNLEYFLVAAEELNFTKAAKRLYISQQSLSTHIANLEKELNVTLFHRTAPLTLTYAGKTLVKRAHQLLYLKNETVKELTDIKDFNRGELSIGISHTRGRVLLPEILPIYKRQYPNIELHILEGNAKELDAALTRGTVDLIVGFLPFVVENVETVPLCEEEILLIVPEDILKTYFPDNHQEIKQQLAKKVDLSLIQDCPFLLNKPGNRVRMMADQLFEEAQVTPNIELETENIETLIALCARNMGIAFYPKMFYKSADILKYYSVKKKLNVYTLDQSKVYGTLAIGYHKGRYLSKATKEFIRIAKENI